MVEVESTPSDCTHRPPKSSSTKPRLRSFNPQPWTMNPSSFHTVLVIMTYYDGDTIIIKLIGAKKIQNMGTPMERGGGEGFDLKKCGTIYPYTVFRAWRITFFLVNRVENQNEPKRPQSGGRLGSFWFSTRPTAMGGTDYNGLGLWDKLRSCSSNCPIIQVHYNQCLPLP